MTSPIYPEFALDFTSGSLDPSVTISRALNTATIYNASGYIEVVNADLPRFNYNPITLSLKGLLIEETRTNVVLQSETFTTTWAAFGYTFVKNYTSPDGTNNATKIIPDNAYLLTNGLLRQTISKTTSPITYTFSIYAKPGEFNLMQLLVRDNASGSNVARAGFNLTLKSTYFAPQASGTFSNVSVSYEDAAEGFTRYCLTFTTGSEAAIRASLIVFDSSATTGDGVSGIYVYGAQLETGDFPTSYISTTTTTVTRNADVATITGANFSSFWQAGKGGATVQAIPSTVSGIRPLIQFDDGTADNLIALRGNTTNPELYIVDATTPQAQIDAGTIAANVPYALTGWWEPNFCAARLDSNARVVDTSATIPTVTQARIGSDGTNYLNGHLATISYYDRLYGQIYNRRKNKVVFNVI